jgi:hypothetical protein
MPKTIDLSEWIKTKVGHDRDYESLNKMSERTGVPLTTLRRLRDGHSGTSKTLSRLAEGLHMELPDFLRMIAEFDADPTMSRALDSEIEARLSTLKDDQKQNILDLIRSMQERNKGAA